MKNLILTFAFIINSVIAFAIDGQTTARATADNVKMYRQAGTSSEIVKSLKSTDNVFIIRKHNPNWTLVTVNDQVGYVVTSELTAYKTQKPLTAEK